MKKEAGKSGGWASRVFGCAAGGSKKIIPEGTLEAMEKEHFSGWQKRTDAFCAMCMDNEEEGYTTVSQEEFLLMPADEVGFTDTRRVEVGMGTTLSKAMEKGALPRDMDSSGRVYPAAWLGKPGEQAKETRAPNAESYGGREESVTFDRGIDPGPIRRDSIESIRERQGSCKSSDWDGQGDRGSYGQRSRGLVDDLAKEGGEIGSRFQQGSPFKQGLEGKDKEGDLFSPPPFELSPSYVG